MYSGKTSLRNAAALSHLPIFRLGQEHCHFPPSRRRQNLAQNPPLRRTGPQGTRNAPDNVGSAAGGFTQAPGGAGGPQTRTRRISRGLPILASATRQVGWLETCYNRGSAPCLRVFARARARARATASAAATLCGCWVSAWTVLPLFIGALRETGA